MSKLLSILIFVGSGVVNGANAESAGRGVWNFDSVLNRGLQFSARVKKAEAATEISTYDVMRARSQFLPRLDLSTSTQRIKTYSDIPGVESLLLSGRDTINHATSRLQLGINLYNGGGDVANWNLVLEKNREAMLLLQLERQSTAEKVLNAYHDFRMTQLDLRAAQLRNDFEKERFQKARLDFEQGQISALALSEATYEQRRKEQIQHSSARKNKTALRNLLALIGESEAGVDMSYVTNSSVDYGRALADYGFSRSNTVNEVVVSSSRIMQSEFNARRPVSRFLPKVELFTRMDHAATSEDSMTKALENLSRDKSYIGVSLTWNFFDGFDSYAEVKAKEHEINKAKADYEVTLDEQRRNMDELEKSLAENEEQCQLEQARLDLLTRKLGIQQQELDVHRRSAFSFRETEIELQTQEIEVEKLKEVVSYLQGKGNLSGGVSDVQ